MTKGGAIALLIWVVASFPLGIIVGRFLKGRW